MPIRLYRPLPIVHRGKYRYTRAHVRTKNLRALASIWLYGSMGVVHPRRLEQFTDSPTGRRDRATHTPRLSTVAAKRPARPRAQGSSPTATSERGAGA